MSQARSKDEMRELFLDECRAFAREWSKYHDKTPLERCEGTLFSVLCLLDGVSAGFPAAVDLVLRPHPDDKADNIENDVDWVVDGMVINDDCHLHDMLYQQKASNP